MEPTITVTRQRLQVTDKSHLSLRLSVYISAIDDEVTARIAKASVAFNVFCSVYIYFRFIKFGINEHLHAVYRDIVQTIKYCRDLPDNN